MLAKIKAEQRIHIINIDEPYFQQSCEAVYTLKEKDPISILTTRKVKINDMEGAAIKICCGA